MIYKTFFRLFILIHIFLSKSYKTVFLRNTLLFTQSAPTNPSSRVVAKFYHPEPHLPSGGEHFQSVRFTSVIPRCRHTAVNRR